MWVEGDGDAEDRVGESVVGGSEGGREGGREG